MHKKILILIFVFAFTACSKKHDLEGFWYGRYINKYVNLPVMIEFNDNLFIGHCMYAMDTSTYKRYGDKFFLNTKYGEKYKERIRLTNNELQFYDYDTDTFVFKVVKQGASHYINDYLNDKEIRFDLPVAYGELVGIGFLFNNTRKIPMYFGYKEDSLVVNFGDSTFFFDHSLNIPLVDFVLSNFNSSSYRDLGVSLFADKNITLEQLNKLKEQLYISGIGKIYFALQTDNYQFTKYLPRAFSIHNKHRKKVNERILKEFDNKLPPSTLSFEEYMQQKKQDATLIKVEKELLLYNGEETQWPDLSTKLKNKIESTYKFVPALIYFENDITLQEYLDIQGKISKIYNDLRENYALEKYGVNVKNLDYVKQDSIIYKYPMTIIEIDSTNYRKYALQYIEI